MTDQANDQVTGWPRVLPDDFCSLHRLPGEELLGVQPKLGFVPEDALKAIGLA